jgi:hypothetical protein
MSPIRRIAVLQISHQVPCKAILTSVVGPARCAEIARHKDLVARTDRGIHRLLNLGKPHLAQITSERRQTLPLGTNLSTQQPRYFTLYEKAISPLFRAKSGHFNATNVDSVDRRASFVARTGSHRMIQAGFRLMAREHPHLRISHHVNSADRRPGDDLGVGVARVANWSRRPLGEF